MIYTSKYKFLKPEQEDYYDVDNFNDNIDKIENLFILADETKITLDALIEALSKANVDYVCDSEAFVVSRAVLRRLEGIEYIKETQTLNITPDISGGIKNIGYDSENELLSFE